MKDEAKACLEDEGVEGVHGGTIMTATGVCLSLSLSL